MSNKPSRATSLDELQNKIGNLFSVLMAQSKPFFPRSTDVIISPFGKCGTTWLQQLFHTLRTRGDSDFDDISRVVPWIETSPGLGLDLDAPQKAEPRGFKSHHTWYDVPKGGRYIVSFRDPGDAALSLYKFFEGWWFEPGSIELDEFVCDYYLGRPLGSSYWEHLVSWWEQRDNEAIMLLTFEAMKQDPIALVKKVADFCDIGLDDDLLAHTLEKTSLPFMLRHKNQFDDLLMREKSELEANLPAGSDSAKVREGKVGNYKKALSSRALAALDDKWQETIADRLSFVNYSEFRAAVERI